MDTEAVAAAVDETAALLRADGADLVLVDANPKTARIEVRLELGGVECLECVVPPDMLAQLVTTDLRKRVRGEFELVLDDPRRTLDAP